MILDRIETFDDTRVCVVRVTMSDGSIGVGMTAPFHADLTADVLHRLLAPQLLGQDARRHEELVDLAYDRNYKFSGSFLCRALAGVDTALWDWRGRVARKSVAEMLGSARTDFDVYASSMRRDNTAEEEVERLAAAVERDGYRAVKLKVGSRLGRGRSDEAQARTTRLIALAGQALGGKVTLFADANGSYAVSEALEVGGRLADAGFTCFEEPCPFQDIEATSEVTAALSIDVSGGEQDYCLLQWRRIIEGRCVDVVQPDVCYVGGFTRALRVAKMAEQAGMKCVPHSSNHSMTVLFAMHLMAVIPNAGPFVEYDFSRAGWAERVFGRMVEVKDGKVSLPRGFGWGATIRDDWLTSARRVESRAGD